jgi:uncharacterized membrane protein YdbT with pleckstrin-like domain
LKSVRFNYSFRCILLPQLIMCGGGVALCLVGALLFFPIILLAIIPAGYGYYLYLVWNTTVYTLTPEYICKYTGIVFKKRNEIPLSGVLKKDLTVYIPGEIDFGTITIETAAQSQNNNKSLEGDLIISNVEKVTSIYEAISSLEQGEI